MVSKVKFFVLGLFLVGSLYGQNSRINEFNTIGWYAFNGQFTLKNKLSFVGEYQWRRNNIITDWQQSLLRVGLNYQVASNASFRAGYGWIETFPYGKTNINKYGKQFTEHRTYLAFLTQHDIGKFLLSHRIMLEQRWNGNYSDSLKTVEDKYVYSNRVRYMFRTQLPLDKNKRFYAAAFDEIFISFGSNVGENIFDQNRIGLLLGSNITQHIRVEGGFFDQTFQLSREINGNNLIQYNRGILVSVTYRK